MSSIAQEERLPSSSIGLISNKAPPAPHDRSEVERSLSRHFLASQRKAVFLMALGWAKANCPTEPISIYSESQSLLEDIQSGAYETQSVRQRLYNKKGPTILIPGNEAADELAKAAATTTDTPP